jgi:hypothetical protein
MITYKNIGLDNIQRKRKRKKEKRINTFGDVCWFFKQSVVQTTQWLEEKVKRTNNYLQNTTHSNTNPTKKPGMNLFSS